MCLVTQDLKLGELTSALLVLAREQAGSAPPALPCAVAEVLGEVVERHRHLLQGRPVALKTVITATPSLVVDRPLLAIALGNLVRNACAYTPQGQVTVTLATETVTVEDTGPGIPAEELPQLFELRRRGRRVSGGAGIGLPLVKRIADRQGWQVDAHPRGGTVFRIRFSPSKETAPPPPD
jgi:signal transduction histidine kinase